MLLLALERSTAIGSVAVYRDHERLYLRCDPVGPHGGPDACAHVDAALSALGLAPAEIGCFAAGLGPGSFSGIRAGLALLHGLALPSQAPVVGVSSAAALAYAAFRRGAVGPVAVVGDARRGRLWLALFEPPAERMRGGDLALVPREGLVDRLPPDAVVVSPDWERLRELLAASIPAGRLWAEPAVPGAEAVAELVQTPDPPLCRPPLPIYLHPAVVAPN